MTSTSRLTRVPAGLPRSFVCVHVNGMICTSKKSSASAATVRLMPSTAIDPFGTICAAERVGIAHAQPPELAFGPDVDDRADGVDVALHEVPAEPRVAAHRALEVARSTRAPARPAPSPASSPARRRTRQSPPPDWTTVRQTPLTATLSPGRDAVADRARDEEPRRTGQVLDGNHVADRLNEAGEHSL